MIRWSEDDRVLWLTLAGAVTFAILAAGLAVAAKAVGSAEPILAAYPLLGALVGGALGLLASGGLLR